MRVCGLLSDPCISGAESRCGSSKDPGMSMHSSTIWEKTVTSWPLNRLYFSELAAVVAGTGEAPTEKR